jgi:hypothetical protein
MMENLEKEIRNYAANKGIKIIEGSLLDTKNKIILDYEDYKDFLDFVAGTEKKLIVMEISDFEEEFFEDSSEEGKINPFKELNEKYKKYLGKIFQIEINWLNEGFSFIFQKTAGWFEEFLEQERLIKEQIEEKETGEEDNKYTNCKECGERFRDFKNRIRI